MPPRLLATRWRCALTFLQLDSARNETSGNSTRSENEEKLRQWGRSGWWSIVKMLMPRMQRMRRDARRSNIRSAVGRNRVKCNRFVARATQCVQLGLLYLVIYVATFLPPRKPTRIPVCCCCCCYCCEINRKEQNESWRAAFLWQAHKFHASTCNRMANVEERKDMANGCLTCSLVASELEN